MKCTSARPGRTAVLVLLLLVTCYFADWTDDNLSYHVASMYTGQPSRSLGGGGMNSDAMLATFARSGAATKDSALEAVFGSPLNGTQRQNDGGSTLALGTSGASTTGNDQSDSMRSRAGLDFSGNSLGLGIGSNSGLGRNAGSAFGLSGSTGFGFSGFAGTGAAGLGASAVGAAAPF